MAAPVSGTTALRPRMGLGLLLQPLHLDLAEGLVRDLGYVPDPSSPSAAWFRRHHHHLVPYCSPDGLSMVELHHDIFPPNTDVRVPMGDLWQRARPAVLGSAPALVLAPAGLALHLA